MKPRDKRLLVALRENRKLTQRHVAAIVEVSPGHMADIESGRRNPSYAVGKRLADLYDVSMDALFEEIPVEYGAPDEDVA